MERRRFKRINDLLNQEAQVLIEHDAHYIPSTIVNFGAGGALLALKDPSVRLRVGDTFSLFFDNGGQLLQLKGKALRTNGREIAFRFSDLTADQQRAIRTKVIRMEIVTARMETLSKAEDLNEFITKTRN